MNTPDLTARLIVGISGASGAAYGVRLLEMLRETPVETHAIVTKAARHLRLRKQARTQSRAGHRRADRALALAQETPYSMSHLERISDVVHPNQDIGANIASGSFRTMGMIVAPCSVKSMSEIASGVTSSLLARAADVALKERRKLVLMIRETPLHRNHLRSMADLSELGAVVAPPVPAFYTNPTSVDDIVDHTVGRVLDLFEIESGTVQRWRGMAPELSDHRSPP